MKLYDLVGNTPLVELRHVANFGNGSKVFAKLEGNNPAGSVKDRPALNMIMSALERGEINNNTMLIEATSGNTGIALSMVAATLKVPITLIMPENASVERRQIMQAYGAKVILVSKQDSMEGARDLAEKMENEGKGKIVGQFSNDDNWKAHYKTTAPEIWQQTDQKISHFVATMGTTGTIMGCSRYFKEQDERIQVYGVQPDDQADIPGIRRWPEEYLPKFYEPHRVDKIIDVSQSEAEESTKKLARDEGIFAGISSGGALHVALKIAQSHANATVVSIVCDRGDRYLSTGVFSAKSK